MEQLVLLRVLANLQELIEIIPKKYGNSVDVVGNNCLELCSMNSEYSKAPYVKVDDDIISEATIEAGCM